MADNWYYVLKGNRQGPVAIEVLQEMVSKSELTLADFVWKKGFENWKKIKEVEELQQKMKAPPAPTPAPTPVAAPVVAVATPTPIKEDETQNISRLQFKDVSLKSLGEESRVIFVRIGSDRGEAPAEFGPFTLKQLKQLFKENRINGKSYVFTAGMKEWKILADFPEYQELFAEKAPVIKDAERRAAFRKPFLARLLIQNNRTVYEGICRDISIGGMQILTDDFKGGLGERISINIHPENTEYHFTASGTVVRILEGNSGFSFRFEGLNDEARRSIEKYIQEN
jgi:hypothetical protein